MKKIAICIPTLNEADNIFHTLSIIDEGLHEYFNQYDCTIVNCDSGSADDTVQMFLGEETKTKKISICTREKGKGFNILNFMNFCKNNSIDYAAMIDADIKTISKEWVYKLITPLICEDIEFVFPDYYRAGHEGNSTRHLAAPIIYKLFKKNIPQPIGGDFGFTRRFIDTFMSKSFNESTLKYGIDINMTFTVLTNHMPYKIVNLGIKKHNDSFYKMIPIFKNVATEIDYILDENSEIRENYAKDQITYEWEEKKKESNQTLNHFDEMNIMYNDIMEKLKFKEDDVMNDNAWNKVLDNFIVKKINVNTVAALFILRVFWYWKNSLEFSVLERLSY